MSPPPDLGDRRAPSPVTPPPPRPDLTERARPRGGEERDRRREGEAGVSGGGDLESWSRRGAGDTWRRWLAAAGKTEQHRARIIERNRLKDVVAAAGPRRNNPLRIAAAVGVASPGYRGADRDYVRLRAVCTHWHSSTVGPRGRGILDPRFHPRRWMMLPEGHGLYPGHPGLGGYVRFFNLSTGALVRAHLPVVDDHILLDSTDGLLLLRGDHDKAIRLLHPFTGDIAELPPLLSLLPQIGAEPSYRGLMEDTSCLGEPRGFLDGVCAAVTVGAAGAVTVMLSLSCFHRVAHATVGDQRWTLADCKLPPHTRSVAHRGRLCGAVMTIHNKKLYICQIDPPQPNAEGLRLLPRPQEMTIKCPLVGLINLVECGSEIMIVGFNDTSYTHLVVYRLADLISNRVIPVTSIGDHVLLLHDHRGVCVSPNKGFPFILGNSIIRRH